MASKRMVVMLDTSDTINLNHLDIIPLQLLSSLESIINVDIERRHQYQLPVDDIQNKLLHFSASQKEYGEPPSNFIKPQSKLSKINTINSEEQKFDDKEIKDGPSKQDHDKTDIKEEDFTWSVPHKVCEKIVKQIRQLEIEDKIETTAALGKLTKTLKDLQPNWKEESPTASNIFNCKKWDYKPPTSQIGNSQDILTPKKIEPFNCQSSNCSVVPTNNIKHILIHKNFSIIPNHCENIRQEIISKSDAIVLSKEIFGDHFHSSTTQNISQIPPLNIPVPILSQQKTADIWNWVSPKYPQEIDSFFTTFNDELTTNQKCGQNEEKMRIMPKREYYKCSLREYAGDEDAGMRFDRDTKKDKIESEYCITRRNTAYEYKDLTPPCTSTWNLSPLYEAAVYESSECLTIVDDNPKSKFNMTSACSITPIVFSRATLKDVHSGDDIVTRCSTASTVTEFEYNCGTGLCGDDKTYKKCVENLSGISNQKLLKILGEFNKGEEQRKKLEIVDKLIENMAMTPLQSATNPESVHEEAPLILNQDSREILSNSKTKIKNTFSLTEKRSTGKLMSSCDIKKIKKKKDKKKTKKKKRKDEDDETSGDDKENKETKETKIKSKKQKAITLFSHFKKKKESGEISQDAEPLQKLKNSLPRTPDGRFAFSSKEAEEAIAQYVRAELAATLEVGEAKLKPGKLRDILCSVSTQQSPSGSGKEINNNGHIKEKPSIISKTLTGVETSSQLAAKKKKPLSLDSNRKSSVQDNLMAKVSRPSCGVIPKQSNRINFIRYQQQSITAMLNISRSKMNKTPGYFKPVDRTVPGFTRPPNSRDLLELVKKRDAAILNAKQVKSNRNAVIVVFGNE